MFPIFGPLPCRGGRGEGGGGGGAKRNIKVDELMVIFCWFRNPSGGTLPDGSGIFIADARLCPPSNMQIRLTYINKFFQTRMIRAESEAVPFH